MAGEHGLGQTVTLRRVGGSLRVSLPADAVRRLHLREGDVLFAVPTDLGLLLTPWDDRVERAVAQWDRLVRSRGTSLRRAARRATGIRQCGYRPLERPGVRVRDDAAVALLLDAPCAAWRTGERSLRELAGRLYPSLAEEPEIGGARALLAALAVQLFLGLNGALTDAGPGRLARFTRTLAGGPGAAAGRALDALYRAPPERSS